MRYQLTNVGRSRFTGVVEVPSLYRLMKEIKKYCASRYIDLDWHGDGTASIFAGYHVIGKVKLLGENEMAKSKSPKKEAKKQPKKKGKGKKGKKNSDDETATDIADPTKPVESEPAPLPTEPPPAPEHSVEMPDEHQPEPGEPQNM